MTQHQGSWLIDRPLSGPALPSGRPARVFGWLLSLNTKELRELAPTLDAGEGTRALEVGHGPGLLLADLGRAGAEIAGVDPSEAMVDMTRRRLRRAALDPARVRVGTAEDTGFPDASFDLTISVNNVPMWSDLGAGFRELHRVLAPGGRLVVAWHGGRKPSRLARKLILPEEILDRVLAALREVFGNGDREDLDRLVVMRATRSSNRQEPGADGSRLGEGAPLRQ